MTTDDLTEQQNRSPANSLPLTRTESKRAQYLERTTDLRKPEARALAKRESGKSQAAIAREMGTTDQTIATYMDRIATQYGLKAIETKGIDERGDPEPISEHRFTLFSDHVLVQWLEMAIRQPEWIPEVVDLERLLDGIDYDQLVETQDTKLLGDIAVLRAKLPLGQEEQSDSSDDHQLDGEKW